MKTQKIVMVIVSKQIETEVMRNKTFLQLKNDLHDRYSNSTRQYLDELFNNWKNNIKNRYNNGTENNLDLLFSAYE